MKKSIILISGMLATSICFAEEGSMTTGAEAPTEAVSTTTETTSVSTGEVSRSAFTTMIDDREPVDNVEQLTLEDNKIMFFTELTGMKGQVVTHCWMHNDKIKATVDFTVGGDRWRVWSSKNLSPSMKGVWTVDVLDGNAKAISSRSFTYGSQ